MDYIWILLVFALVTSALAESCRNCGGKDPCQCVRARNCRLTMDVLEGCETKLFCCPEADILQDHKRIEAWPKYQSLRKLNYIAGSWINYPPEMIPVRRTFTTTTTTTAPDDDECGIRTLNPTRISFGNKAMLGEYPWIVALRYQSRNGNSDLRIMCGGSLITRRHVLTAAHCVKNVEDRATREKFDLKDVGVGEHDISNERDCVEIEEKVICSTSEYIPVEGDPFTPTKSKRYIPKSLKNDIAVVKLQSEVPITDFIRPICIPSAHQQLATGQSVLISGWGLTLTTRMQSQVLLHNDVVVTDFNSCVKKYFQRDKLVVSPLMFCAGRGNVDSCPGDSGGPVMRAIDGKFYVMGLVSFGPDDDNCGFDDVPGVYTNVTNYLDFIQNSISS